MSSEEITDLRDVGALLAFGLRPMARPASEPFYRALLHRYQDDTIFRSAVIDVAEGMGLQIVGVSVQGLVLAPVTSSIFAMRWEDYRNQSTDDRLIDGLIFIAIMTTLFPRPEDLDEDPLGVRRPITVEEVEQVLRILCNELESQSRQQPDISAEDELAGLFEAWRAYHHRSAVNETADNRRSQRAIPIAFLSAGMARLTQSL